MLPPQSCHSTRTELFYPCAQGELEAALKSAGLSTNGDKRQLFSRLEAFQSARVVVGRGSRAPEVPAEANPDLAGEATKKKKTQRKQRSSKPADSKVQKAGAKQQECVDRGAALLKLSKAELQAIAAELDVAKSGTKAQIVARILEAQADPGAVATHSAPLAPVAPSSEPAPKPPRRRKQQAKAAAESEAELIPASGAAVSAALEIVVEPMRDTDGAASQSQEQAPQRRRLSPEEAAQLLEQLVQQSGTGRVGLDDSGSDPASNEVARMKAAIATFKEELSQQEESAERLRIALLSPTAGKTAGEEAASAVTGIINVSMQSDEGNIESGRSAVVAEGERSIENGKEGEESSTANAASTTAQTGDDIVKGQGAVGVAVAAGLLAVGEVAVSMASVAGKMVKRLVGNNG